MSDKKTEKVETPKEAPKELTDQEKSMVLLAKVLGDTLNAQRQAPPAGPPLKRQPVGGQCPDCGQPQFLDPAKGLFFSCDSKHEKIVVLPNEADHFIGVAINGVWYKSNNHSHLLTVPKENEIRKYLENWDRQEREYRTGRKISPARYNPSVRPPTAGAQE